MSNKPVIDLAAALEASLRAARVHSVNVTDVEPDADLVRRMKRNRAKGDDWRTERATIIMDARRAGVPLTAIAAGLGLSASGVLKIERADRLSNGDNISQLEDGYAATTDDTRRGAINDVMIDILALLDTDARFKSEVSPVRTGYGEVCIEHWGWPLRITVSGLRSWADFPRQPAGDNPGAADGGQ